MKSQKSANKNKEPDDMASQIDGASNAGPVGEIDDDLGLKEQ